MRRPWTYNEIEKLKDYVKSGYSEREIAEKLDRTRDAVSCKKRKLNLYSTEERLPLCMILTQKEKEDRLYRLMEKLGIRLRKEQDVTAK